MKTFFNLPKKVKLQLNNPTVLHLNIANRTSHVVTKGKFCIYVLMWFVDMTGYYSTYA